MHEGLYKELVQTYGFPVSVAVVGNARGDLWFSRRPQRVIKSEFFDILTSGLTMRKQVEDRPFDSPLIVDRSEALTEECYPMCNIISQISTDDSIP